MIEFNVDGAPFDKMGNICTIMVGHRVVTTASHWPLSAGVNSDCVPLRPCHVLTMVIFSWCAVIDAPTSIPSHFRRMRFSWRVSRYASVECEDWDRCNFDVISWLRAGCSMVKLINDDFYIFSSIFGALVRRSKSSVISVPVQIRRYRKWYLN